MVDWLTPADVGALIEGADVDGNDVLTRATAAARAFVERKRREFDTGTEAGYVVTDDDVLLGAAMLAARLYERRGALLGAAGFADFGAASDIVRQDPDIALLLQLGTYAPFGFGAPS